MSPNTKAPSAGTKVTMGQNAPVASEATGAVAADSLAAESQAFRQNNEVAPQSLPHEDLTAKPVEKSTTAVPRNAEPAPTYVTSQYTTYPGGPHGKNIKEDPSIGTEDKEKNTSFSEFGTDNDPAAAAQHKIVRGDVTPANASGGREKTIDGKTPFDVLGSEREL